MRSWTGWRWRSTLRVLAARVSALRVLSERLVSQSYKSYNRYQSPRTNMKQVHITSKQTSMPAMSEDNATHICNRTHISNLSLRGRLRRNLVSDVDQRYAAATMLRKIFGPSKKEIWRKLSSELSGRF